MSILYNILGKPGRDNALYIKINSGKRFYRLLFDCGESVLASLDQSEIKSIDYIFFSHCHIDHVAGFDYLFRRIYDREKPVVIYGPPGITKIIFNRLNGFTWNLVSDLKGEWIINEFENGEVKTSVIKASDSFSKISSSASAKRDEFILLTQDFGIKMFFLNHSISSAGYLIKEKETYNIDKDLLAQLGITAGEWLQKVKDENSDINEIIYTGGRSYSVLYLKELLLRKKEGDSLAYMTDFVFDGQAEEAVKIIKNCDTIVCESQYLEDEKHLAEQNFHITGSQAGKIAADAEADKLILFHVSDRYRGDDFLAMLDEARVVFPKTYYPPEWKI